MPVKVLHHLASPYSSQDCLPAPAARLVREDREATALLSVSQAEISADERPVLRAVQQPIQ